MKRYGNLWHQVIEPANIQLAYKYAKRGKAWQRSVKAVEKDLEAKLEKVLTLLRDHTFTTSEYRTKYVLEPKPRTIYVLPFFPDRIIQHAVMNVVAPLWNRMFDHGSHACRPGKGQHTASRDVMRHIRGNRYVLQADIRKFYPSISQDIAVKIVKQKIKDPDVLWLLEDIIKSFPGEKNIPIGNLTSQWIGNLYLDQLDKYVRHEIKPEGYIRYNDDFLLFGNEKTKMQEWRVCIREYLSSQLDLEMSKDKVYPVSEGIDYVGYRHFRDKILVRKSTARRMRKKVSHLRYLIAINQIDPERARSVVASVKGWLRWANAQNLKRTMRIDELEEEIIAAI